MGYWFHKNATKQAWDYLEKHIAADILLVQEAMPPSKRQNEFCVWREIGGKNKRGGSGVLTKELPITELRLERNDYPGALVVANVTLPDNSVLVVVSVYGQLDRSSYSKHRYSTTTLHRMVSDLTRLLDGDLQKRGRPRIIFGGDLNASPQFDDQYGTKTHRNFFQRLEAVDLVDCQGQFTNARPRTLRHSKSKFPWVNDYIYTSESLEDKIVKHQVIEQPEMLKLSDHNPVVVTFDL